MTELKLSTPALSNLTGAQSKAAPTSAFPKNPATPSVPADKGFASTGSSCSPRKTGAPRNSRSTDNEEKNIKLEKQTKNFQEQDSPLHNLFRQFDLQEFIELEREGRFTLNENDLISINQQDCNDMFYGKPNVSKIFSNLQRLVNYLQLPVAAPKPTNTLPPRIPNPLSVNPLPTQPSVLLNDPGRDGKISKELRPVSQSTQLAQAPAAVVPLQFSARTVTVMSPAPANLQKKALLGEENICGKTCNVYQIGGNFAQPYGQSYTFAIEKTDTSAIQEKIAQGLMWEFHLVMAAHEYIRIGSLVARIVVFYLMIAS
jgi:hypothetical protein